MPTELKKADIRLFLKFVEYPARKEDLLEKAFFLGAPKDFMDDLNKLPDKAYFSIRDIEEHFEQLNIQIKDE